MVKRAAMAWGLLLGMLLVTGPDTLAGSDEPGGGPPAASPGLFTLGEGDLISVFVWKNPALSKDLPVRPDGKISYPLIGELDAAGLTVKQIEEKITNELKQHVRDPQVTVTLQEVHSFGIYVVGEVVRPGMFQLRGPITVIQALAMAGGFTPYASKGQILILRKTQRLPFNYMRYVDGAELDKNVVLQPGDTIVVP